MLLMGVPVTALKRRNNIKFNDSEQIDIRKYGMSTNEKNLHPSHNL